MEGATLDSVNKNGGPGDIIVDIVLPELGQLEIPRRPWTLGFIYNL